MTLTPTRLDDMQDGYVEIVERVLKDGTETSPRGMRTRELRNVSFTLTDTSKFCPVGVGRRVHYPIGAAESMHLVGGLSDARQLQAVAPNFSRFVENDRLMGAYGPRTYRQVPEMLRRLIDDPDSRQAGLSIWRPDELAVKSKDLPCTLDMNFSVRDEKLDMSVVMRSNDVVWGLTFDVWMFVSLQSAVAYALGREMGVYTHHAWSLHAYVDRDQEILDRLHAFRDGEEEHPPLPFASSTRDRREDLCLSRWRQVRSAAQAAAGVRPWGVIHDAQPSARWYRDVLAGTSGERTCTRCRYVLGPEWFPTRVNDRLCLYCDVDARYGLPVDTYSRMFLGQGGRCAICDKTTEKLLHLDHDHVTGHVRGLLCPKCNTGLGKFDDETLRLAAAAAYLNTDSWTRRAEYRVAT